MSKRTGLWCECGKLVFFGEMVRKGLSRFCPHSQCGKKLFQKDDRHEGYDFLGVFPSMKPHYSGVIGEVSWEEAEATRRGIFDPITREIESVVEEISRYHHPGRGVLRAQALLKTILSQLEELRDSNPHLK